MISINNGLSEVAEIEEETFEYLWPYMVEAMDNEIREQVHCDLCPCNNKDFLERYCILHAEKFGEVFTI